MVPLLLTILAFLGTLFGEPQTAEQRFVAAARKQREEALANLSGRMLVPDQRGRAAGERAAAQPWQAGVQKLQPDIRLPAAAATHPLTSERRLVEAAHKQHAEDLANLPELMRIGDEQRRKWAEERASNLAREQAAWQAQQEAQRGSVFFPAMGSGYGAISDLTGRPKTVFVHDYYRKDGTHVTSHYRSPPRRR